jgi:phosphoserine phosphatase
VSGGIRQAILPLARTLGFTDADVSAVSLSFDDAGAYRDYDRASPLATQSGKAEVVNALLASGRLSRPLLAVGDGATDVAMREHADTFAAYVGFARRETVVARADLVVSGFDELARVVLGDETG